jgi:hypothetical protein
MSQSSPVLGPMAKAALRVETRGQKRRKLLVLIAAYADAGNSSPGFALLGPRLQFLEWAPAGPRRRRAVKRLDELVAALQRDGLLEIVAPADPRQQRATTYRLLFDVTGKPLQRSRVAA